MKSYASAFIPTLCDETAERWYSQSVINISGGLKRRPGTWIVWAVREEPPGKRMKRQGIAKVKINLVFLTDGAIYSQYNLIYGAPMNREIHNPWHFVKRLPDCTVDTLTRLSQEWIDQGYDVTCKDSKRIRAALVMLALKGQNT